ncbi:MAG: hypothetical protein JWO89_2372 [Verrucomicrobiaceae bacterium]|nr:hypothetical protein [Verrucomicrobiaceae bacterium]
MHCLPIDPANKLNGSILREGKGSAGTPAGYRPQGGKAGKSLSERLHGGSAICMNMAASPQVFDNRQECRRSLLLT